MSVNEKMTAIAEAIRSRGGNSSLLTLDDMVLGVEHVYSNGVDMGYTHGINDGAQAEYDRFWETLLQRLGGNWYHTFRRWSDDIFNPDVTIKGGAFSYTFANATITKIGVVDMSNETMISSVFQECYYLVTINKIILPNNIDVSSSVSSWTFAYCYALENISFEGEFKNNGWNFQWSKKLAHDSIVGIVNALSATESGLSITLSITAVDNAFETSAGAADGVESDEWAALIATKSNWTISLV